MTNAAPLPTPTRAPATPQVATLGDAAYVSVSGYIDERFPGFGQLDGMQTVVIDLGAVSMMSSFGVRQWLRSMRALPKTAENVYLINCPPIIVDQLNMILNFGGQAKLVSMSAPFVCTKCGRESREIINVMGERADIEAGKLALRSCKKCASPLELDEIIESYFACVHKYGAETLVPAAAQLIAQGGSMRKQAVTPSITPSTDHPSDVPPAGVLLPPPATARAPAPPSRKSYAMVIAVGLALVLLAVGAYVLFGPR